MRQRHFPGSLTDWVSPFCAACHFIHLRTSFISFFGEVMLAAVLSKQDTLLSGLAATSTPYSLLQVRLSAEALAVHIHITKTQLNSPFLAQMGENEVLSDRTRCQKLDTLVFVGFDSSFSATVWFLGSKHLALPIKRPQHKWPQCISAGEHCGAVMFTISRALLFSDRDCH